SGEDRDDRNDRPERQDRGERQSRNERFARSNRPRRDDRPADEDDGREDRRPRINGGDDSLPLDVLPPAIGRDVPGSEDSAEEVPRRPRRTRARAPRDTDGDHEIAPAA